MCAIIGEDKTNILKVTYIATVGNGMYRTVICSSTDNPATGSFILDSHYVKVDRVIWIVNRDGTIGKAR